MSETNIKKVKSSDLELKDKLVALNRVTKVTKGGRTFTFAAIVVVGNENGVVGHGLGKAKEVQEAIAKGIDDAKKNLVKVPVLKGTIPHITGRQVRRSTSIPEASRTRYRCYRRRCHARCSGERRYHRRARQEQGQQQPAQRGEGHDRGADEPARCTMQWHAAWRQTGQAYSTDNDHPSSDRRTYYT